MPMDSPDFKKEAMEEESIKRRCFLYIFCWNIFRIFFTILATFLLSFLVLLVAIFLGNLSIWNPISVPSQCKIVSSSVDLRSSKVCELGLLNYKAKHVFYPYERKKFRCRYDYYWASVFEVEYVDHSGQQRLALAEAPNEALPSSCRPSFGAAWLTKDKFKVNETYDCWYTLGISKVNIHQDGLFNCQAKDPSTAEMIRRYFILSMTILKSWFTSSRSLKNWRLDVVAGVIAGFFTSLITVVFVRILHQLKSSLRQFFAVSMQSRYLNLLHLRRACFFVAYFSFMGWLTLLYVKKITLLEILGVRSCWWHFFN
ncbi:hypothetical protein ACH5RR_040717 [Cinchona calisaya]|uniref:Uncharacterized protein n=1 Tax=Cinchona calisaya TaxID=153742 RepID=A0ABD2XVK1_9GENT